METGIGLQYGDLNPEIKLSFSCFPFALGWNDDNNFDDANSSETRRMICAFECLDFGQDLF